MPVQTSSTATRKTSSLIWTPFLLLCLIAAAAAIRRIVVLALPPAPVPPAASPNAALDAVFSARKGLTLAHIVPALGFVTLLPFWFAERVRARPHLHRRITQALFVLGAVTGLTAIPMSARPVGGVTEQSASLLYAGLFLFFLARAWLSFRTASRRVPLASPERVQRVEPVSGDSTQRMNMHRTPEWATHRIWMMRAIAVLLGIATTRPVMGVFFATQRLTHLRPDQFFGIAFWIGFTTTYLAGEWYLQWHSMAQRASERVRSSSGV